MVAERIRERGSALSLSEYAARRDEEPAGNAPSAAGETADKFVVAVARGEDGDRTTDGTDTSLVEEALRHGGPYRLPVKVVGVTLGEDSYGELDELSGEYPELIAVVGETNSSFGVSHSDIPALSSCEWADYTARSYDGSRVLGLAPSPDQRAAQLGGYLRDTLKKRKLLVLEEPDVGNGEDPGAYSDLRDMSDALSSAVNGTARDGRIARVDGLVSAYKKGLVRGQLKEHRPDAVFLNVPPKAAAKYARELGKQGFTGTVVTRPDTESGKCALPTGSTRSTDPPSGTLRYRYLSEGVRRSDCTETKASWCDRVMNLDLPRRGGRPRGVRGRPGPRAGPGEGDLEGFARCRGRGRGRRGRLHGGPPANSCGKRCATPGWTASAVPTT